LLYGQNVITQAKSKHWTLIFLKQFISPFEILLLISGIASLLTYRYESEDDVLIKNEVYVRKFPVFSQNLFQLSMGLALLIAAVILGIVSFIQQLKTEEIERNMKISFITDVVVIRNGQERKIRSSEVKLRAKECKTIKMKIRSFQEIL